ncbi:hypothetical protein HZP68_17500 [Elizabethkingia anophelis]|nr:hypothetical protein [Elizabethkingia anophelis]
MKQKKKLFEQHIYHEIDDQEKAEEYLENSLPLIGLIVMYFNGLEKSLDNIICQIFTDRSDSTGLIVLHKMSYATKVDLFKRFSEDFHFACDVEIEGYQTLISNLRESGRLRNLVVHADWENTDTDGYTYVNLKISSKGMEQEYLQFSADSLGEIIDLIITSRNELHEYWEKRNDELYK